jgi:hypothetical protein
MKDIDRPLKNKAEANRTIELGEHSNSTHPASVPDLHTKGTSCRSF